jgi:ribosomal protein L3 glutamine methyltransferase
MTRDADDNLDELVTVRDWLRFATSRFRGAGLVFGHGTSTALDEAAFLVLETLHLPIDQLEPWLGARLTRAERAAVLDIVEQRIATRKPAAYLTGTAYIQGHRFAVDERVIVPRSYIGELLATGGLDHLLDAPPLHVLDLCTGSGCLAILAALRFPEATVDAVELSADALEVARRNVAEHGLEARVRLLEGDIFTPLGTARYDLVIANPPYVAGAEVAAFAPEFRAEPELAHLGGPDGLDLVRRIIASAGAYLEPGGLMVMEIGTGRALIEAEFPTLPFAWLDTAESVGEVLAIGADDLAPPPREKGFRGRYA